MAARGVNIIVAYGHNKARAKRACDELRNAHGVTVHAVGGDLTAEDSRTEVVESIFAQVNALGGNMWLIDSVTD